MRIPTLAPLCLLLLTACQTNEHRAARRPLTQPSFVAVEAALRNLPLPPSASAADTAEVIAVEAVVAELLRSAFRTHAAQRRIILENIANVHTPGFKKRVVLVRTKATTGADGIPVPIPVLQEALCVFTPGAIERTERQLDVAIDGDGFFSVVTENGRIAYTRAGSWHVNRNGKIVTGDGMVLTPEVTVPSDTLEISVAPDGKVTGRTAGSPDTSTSFGEIMLHRFVDPAGLLPVSASVWRETDSSGNPMTGRPGDPGIGLLAQGFLERSNVELDQELLNLQMLERQHSVLTRVLAQFGMIAP